jgi:hypothetical protein
MALPSFCPVSTHDPLAVLPKNPIAVMQTPMIRANMTAYSTAVAPFSSQTKSSIKNRKKRFIVALLTIQIPRLIVDESLARQAK